MKKFLNYIFLQIIIIYCISISYAQETTIDLLKQHVYVLASDSLMGRQAGSEDALKAAVYIANQFEAIGIKPLLDSSYFIPFKISEIRGGTIYKNVAAIIEGSDSILKNEYIIVGAHYDHLGAKIKNDTIVIYHGADDNASGVATIIEMGRKLKEIQSTLKRSIILVAFDAEEIGLFGSADFIENPPIPAEKIKLMFSVDMVGWYKTSGYIKYEGTKTIKNGKKYILNKNLSELGLNVKTKNFENSIFGSTDSESFAKKNIPTLYVSTGLRSPYHKPEDMAHLIDYQGLEKITEHITQLVTNISNDENFSASNKISSKHKNKNKLFVAGIALNLGSNHHKYTAGALNGKTAFAGGIGFNIQVNIKSFAIRPEIYYDYLNAYHPLGKITTHSITTPLNFILQVPYTYSSGVALLVGPYYNYKFYGKQKNKILDFENYYNIYEIGLNLGFEFRSKNLRMGFTSRIPFTNFTKIKNDDDAYIKNVALFFTLGFVF